MDLEQLYRHEVGYFQFSSHFTEKEYGWILTCADLPTSRDVNRVLRLRDDGSGPESIVESVVQHFRESGIRPTVEIDEVSESQGIGRAFRRRGITPVIDSRSLMRFDGEIAYVSTEDGGITVERVDGDPIGVERWLETVLHEVEDYDYPEMWKELAKREARYAGMRLYLGFLKGKPAGTCSVYTAGGLSRIEMVETRKEYRRLGVASAVVCCAVQDTLRESGTKCYLYTECGSDAERLYLRLGFTQVGVDIMRRHIHM